MIFKNAFIITQNSQREIIKRGYIRLTGKKIAEIGSKEPSKIAQDNAIDLNGSILMPGLINAHCHMGDFLYEDLIGKLKSPADILMLTNKIDEKIGLERKKKLKQQSAFKVLSIMVKNGVTTLAGGMGAKESRERGIRFIGGAMLKGEENIALVIDKIENECCSDLNIPGIFIHSLLEISPDKLAVLGRELKRRELKKQPLVAMLHMGEFPEEKEQIFKRYQKERLEILQESGLLSKTQKLIIIHGNYIEENELKKLSKYNIGFVLCPVSARTFGFKTINLECLKKYKIKKAIASDGPLTNPEHRLMNKLKCILSPQCLLDMVTIEAAEVLGMADKIGSIECGKMADMLILNSDVINVSVHSSYTDIENILAKIISGEFSKFLNTVIVNGKSIHFC